MVPVTVVFPDEPVESQLTYKNNKYIRVIIIHFYEQLIIGIDLSNE